MKRQQDEKDPRTTKKHKTQDEYLNADHTLMHRFWWLMEQFCDNGLCHVPRATICFLHPVSESCRPSCYLLVGLFCPGCLRSASSTVTSLVRQEDDTNKGLQSYVQIASRPKNGYDDMQAFLGGHPAYLPQHLLVVPGVCQVCHHKIYVF